jgi:cytochrome d ubiquinol oxidase subunit I
LRACGSSPRRPVFKNLYLFWVKIFALSFGMGVVSGVVMSYQFGTNWSVFSTIAGSVIGPLLAYEVLTAFFLEASFLGIMLFGWKRVGPAALLLDLHGGDRDVVLGVLDSLRQFLDANAARLGLGRRRHDGRDQFHGRDLQSVAAIALRAHGAGGVLDHGHGGRWRVRVRAAEEARALAESRVALRMAVLMMALVTPVQIMAGHESGIVAGEHQPAKVAALEGWWTTRTQQPTVLIGWPDERPRPIILRSRSRALARR